jgi:hypothetical protein
MRRQPDRSCSNPPDRPLVRRLGRLTIFAAAVHAWPAAALASPSLPGSKPPPTLRPRSPAWPPCQANIAVQKRYPQFCRLGISAAFSPERLHILPSEAGRPPGHRQDVGAPHATPLAQHWVRSRCSIDQCATSIIDRSATDFARSRVYGRSKVRRSGGSHDRQ